MSKTTKHLPMSEKIFDFGGYLGEKRAQTYARLILKPRVNSRFGFFSIQTRVGLRLPCVHI